MKKQGAILVDPAPIETAGKFGDSEFIVLLYELKADSTPISRASDQMRR